MSFNEEKKILTLSDLLDNRTVYNTRNVTFFKEVDGLIISDYNLFNKYLVIINSLTETYETDAEQRARYRFRPGLLSNEMYGTTELADLILFLNDRESPSDFIVKKKIRLMPMENVEYFFDTIVLQNQDFLEKNKMDMGL